MQLRRLTILMWKHFMVRLRRFIHTPIEFLSPIVFILILYCFKDKIKAERPGVEHDSLQIRHTDVVNFGKLSTPGLLLYTPDNNHTNTIMQAVGHRLNITQLHSIDLSVTKKGYYAFSNFSEVNDWLEKLKNNDAIIQFHDLDGEEWPDYLSYTIRMRGAFFTGEISALDGVAKPHREFGREYYRFLTIQWALDTSFIEILTGNIITLPLSVQEFPSIGRAADNDDNGQMKMIGQVLEAITIMSVFLIFVFLMARLLEERATGIQELVKMVGVSSNLFGISHFLNVLPGGLVYCVVGTCLLKGSSNPLIEHSNGLIIFLMLLLHFVSVISMAFACSYITQSNQYTVTLSVFAYIALCAPSRLLSSYNKQGMALAAGLLPHEPMQWLWKEIAAREEYGEGITFSEIFSSHSGRSGPVALGALCLVLQSLVMFSLTWYLARVRPGQYGQALPWNFLFQKQYWSQNEVKPESEHDEEQPIAREPRYFEEPPRNMEAGIKIENVTKVFPKHTALNNVSLDVYKGEITVLLGHNGAGKTTLMSIITGMMSATEGRVLVNGVDTKQSSDEVRMHLGLCPQHNLFFPDITVLEHVMFFTLLKGGSFKTARVSSLELLGRLGLREKAGVHSSALSGGMKRRLQLACALAGGADVLVLDEPTSGLDVETRRELWDLLLSLRGERTVLLTTHFMEEADALGDRVAALHLGRLRCHATTMYLKKAIGTGYRLTFTTNGPPRETAVTQAVTSIVPDATLKEKSLNSLAYNLPATASGDFPELFTALEEEKLNLGIETIGVGISTLEEVFLKLCSDTDTTFAENESDKSRTEPTYNKVTGLWLWRRQSMALLRRQCRYVWYRKISFFALQIIIPISMIFLFTTTANNERVRPTSDRILLDLDLYAPLAERRVLCDVTDDVNLRALNDAYPKSTFIRETNVTGEVLRASEKEATDYRKYIAGIEIDDNHIKALYTSTVRHAAPVSLGLVSNALATRYLGARADGRTFRAHLEPIPPRGGIKFSQELVEPKSIDHIIVYSIFMVFIIFSTNINAVSLPCKERASGARHIHMMCGCSAVLHWTVTCAFHATCCAICLVSTVGVTAFLLDKDATINPPVVVLSLMLVVMVGSLAFFALTYLVSFFFQERVASIVLVAILIIFSLITTTIKTATDVLSASEEDSMSFWDGLIALCSYTMPPHGTTIAFAKVAYSARLNAFCNLNKHKCPNLFVLEFGFDKDKCCAGQNPRCYMCMDKFAPGKELVILTVQFFVYMTLVILTQRGVFNSLHDLIFNGRYRNSAHTNNNEDEIVRAEAIYVNKQIALPKKKIDESGHAMLVSDLHKNYHQLIGKSCNAVKGISFSVKKGECFGLLGVNGAGKSTTFKMLTAEECPTKGQIYANGYFRREREPYLRSLGYCPQFFGLDEFQTGRENLALLLTLRGLDAEDVARETKSWIKVVGLQKYSARLVSGYSGGCTRRLAAAAALCTGAPLTLLDEPTAGVDVSARRRVWRALQRGLEHGRAVVITSHSMDEMEALCSRIAIMSGGVIRAVGTPSELRAHHAAGHAVLIKVAHATHADEVDGGKSELQRLKSTLQSKFNCTLKDEHKTMLHYHINETMRYSNLFTALEELKATYPGLVEDYSVTETTLEEVFLSFAKEQRVAAPPERNHVV